MVRKRSWVQFPLEAPIGVIMKASFSEFYARLYNENFNELEAMREKAKRSSVGLIFIIAALFILATINVLFVFVGFMAIVIYFMISHKKSKKIQGNISNQNKEKSYKEVFKEKIVGPLIENVFEQAKYDPKSGIDRFSYVKAGYHDHIDRYHSEDLILAPLRVNGEIATSISFAEVLTERESKDSEGRTTYSTEFHGLAGSFLLPKNLEKKIYIRDNWSVSNWNKNKVKMDMSEFEKIFDVESDDKILTMRILTADVMADMIDLYRKYKYRFEISILDDTVHMRLRTGEVFEPNVFKSSMEYKTLERYYLVLQSLINIAEKIYDTIAKIEI